MRHPKHRRELRLGAARFVDVFRDLNAEDNTDYSQDDEDDEEAYPALLARGDC